MRGVPVANPRKPTVLKILAGNPGKRKLPVEREVEHAPPSKPQWVSVDPVASPVWDELAPSRVAIGLLSDKTADAFGQLCFLLGEFRRNPMSGLDGPRMVHMRHLMTAFGMEPSALAKHGIATSKPQKVVNPFADIAK
jgi:phage terminase small subunit